MLTIKRVYEKPHRNDGTRVLVDRLWPRGLSKHGAKVDLWLKEIAPSTALRKWFGHDPKKWPVFKKRYIAQLRANKGAVNELRMIIKKHRKVTLVYGAKDDKHNQASVLHDFMA